MGRQILLLTIVLVMTGGIVDGKPSLHRSRQRSAYGSFGDFEGGALSASSYDSLGIQPSAHRSSKPVRPYYAHCYVPCSRLPREKDFPRASWLRSVRSDDEWLLRWNWC